MSKVRGKVRKGKGGLDEDVNIKSTELLCCVPEDIGSVECAQKVISDPETAVKMSCSNLQCTNSGLLHVKCFERLKKHLLSALGSTPKGKKWTEAQLEANLWNCRGADILHKFSKCSCGGTLAKAEEEGEAPLPVPVKKKEKGKVNQKPKLNCGEGGKISDQKMFKWGLEEPAGVKELGSIKQPKTAAPEPKPAPSKAPSTISKTHQLPLRSQLPLLKSDLPLLKADLPVNKYSKGGSCPWTGKGPYQGQKTLEDISKILHVFNLPKHCSENNLGDLFQAYGKVTDVWISAPPRNFAFVTFTSAKGVDKVLADIPIRYGCHTLTVERKKVRASKVSVSSSTCSRDECFCPANQLCTCATSIPIPPVEHASLRRNTWSSVTPPTKPSPASVACSQEKMKFNWKPVGPSSLSLTGESLREIIQELEDPVDAEMFFSDDEEEGEEGFGDLGPPSVSGSNGNCEEVEQNRLQGEPDGTMTLLEDLLQEKNTLELEKRQLWVANMKQEGELFQAKACNAALKQKLEALEGQHQWEKELMEKVLEEAKACNKVLRERVESVQEQLKQKVTKEKILEETVCEGKEIEARMKRESEQLKAEVCRLTEALTTSSMEDRDGVNSRRMLRETRSAPGGLAGHTPLTNGEESSREDKLQPLWECSICTFHNPESKSACEMCSKPRPANAKDDDPSIDVVGSTCTICSLFNGPGTRTCLSCGTKLD